MRPLPGSQFEPPAVLPYDARDVESLRRKSRVRYNTAPMNQPKPAVLPADRHIAAAINHNYLGDEEQIVRRLADLARVSPELQARIATRAQQLVEGVRTDQTKRTGLDAFLRKYDLS